LDTFSGDCRRLNENANKGKHFFWRKYPGQPRSLRMYLEGEQLVPQDPRFQRLGGSALSEKPSSSFCRTVIIYPSLFMIFSALCFYRRRQPLAGYGRGCTWSISSKPAQNAQDSNYARSRSGRFGGYRKLYLRLCLVFQTQSRPRKNAVRLRRNV